MNTIHLVIKNHYDIIISYYLSSTKCLYPLYKSIYAYVPLMDKYHSDHSEHYSCRHIGYILCTSWNVNVYSLYLSAYMYRKYINFVSSMHNFTSVYMSLHLHMYHVQKGPAILKAIVSIWAGIWDRQERYFLRFWPYF